MAGRWNRKASYFLAVNFPAFHPAGGRKDKAGTSIFVLLKSLGDPIGRFILKKAGDDVSSL